MKKIIPFLLLLYFFLNIINGQTQSLNGLYKVDSEQYVWTLCIKDDTLSFVCTNKTGIISTQLALSSFEMKRNTIILHKNIIDYKTSRIQETEGKEDEIHFSIFLKDTIPMKYARVLFFEDGNLKFGKIADDNASLVLGKDELAQLDNSLCAEVEINRLGFSTKHFLCLQIGKSYLINGLISASAFDLSPKKIKISINKDNPNEIIIKRRIGYRYRRVWEKITLTKIGECGSCFDLFEELK